LPVGVASNGWVPLTAVVSNTPAIVARVVPKPFLARIVMEFGEDNALVLCGGYGHEAAKHDDASPAYELRHGGYGTIPLSLCK
jgi:hypothetical protein